MRHTLQAAADADAMTGSAWFVEPSHHREHHADERDEEQLDNEAAGIAEDSQEQVQSEASAMAEALRESAEGFDAVEPLHVEDTPEP